MRVIHKRLKYSKTENGEYKEYVEKKSAKMVDCNLDYFDNVLSNDEIRYWK